MKPAFLIVGLGNPGSEYEGTRHNIGFQAVEVLAKHLGASPWKKRDQKCEAHVSEGNLDEIPLLLVKPATFMNRSGESLQKLISFFQLNPANALLVLCDDVDLPPGELRLRKSGGPGTHNGLRSIVDHIGASFPRLRIGVGSPVQGGGSAQKAGEDLSAYVLSRPNAPEQKLIDRAIAKVPEAVQEFIKESQ